MEPKARTVSELLQDFSKGDPTVAKELLPLIYAELKQIAAQRLRRERGEITISTTDLVHEAYLRLFDQPNQNWESRTHFFAQASEIMRRILVDHARKQNAVKRGGTVRVISIEDVPILSNENLEMILLVHDALQKLEALDWRQGKIVVLRFFVGLTIEETAFALGISEATVKRDWAFAKAWLSRELAG